MTCCVSRGIEEVKAAIAKVVVGVEGAEIQSGGVVGREGDFAEFTVGEVDVAGFGVRVCVGWVAWVEDWVGFEAGADDEGCRGGEMGGVADVVPVPVAEKKVSTGMF